MSEIKLDASGLVTPSVMLGDNVLSSEEDKLIWNGEEIKGSGGHNVGEQWISMDGTIPFGGLAFLGQTVSKETYIELYNWVESNGRFKTEAEWQSLYTANNGNVSFYAKVDDTSFRLPSFKGYLKANTTAGGYTKEGLPNITGYFNKRTDNNAHTMWAYGAFNYAVDGNEGSYYYGNNNTTTGFVVSFDASRSSSIYGNSTHVTPETNTILIGVYAINTIINPSELDLETLRLDNLNYVTKANGEISTKLTVTAGREAIFRKNGARLYLCSLDDTALPGEFILRCPKDESCTEYIDLKGNKNGNLTWGGKQIIRLVESWQSGTHWYRKYSDGWIEQGGYIGTSSNTEHTINLHTAFSNTNYFLVKQLGFNGYYGSGISGQYLNVWGLTTSSFKTYGFTVAGVNAFRWYACGY